MGYTVIKHGKFFDVAATDGEKDAAIDLMKEEVANQAYDIWQGLLVDSIRVNRFRYMSGNRFESRGNSWVVHDDLAKPYGPWLEGLGSRNSADGFPGYHALERAAEATETGVSSICEPIVDELCDSLNEPT